MGHPSIKAIRQLQNSFKKQNMEKNDLQILPKQETQPFSTI